MSPSVRAGAASAVALAAVFVLAGCSSPPSGSTQKPAGATQGPAAVSAGPPTTAPAAGEPCSSLTAEAVGAIVGTVPIEVAERIGRGDCDYWLTAAKDSKVNIGVNIGPDALNLFEATKGLGSPQTVNLGDEAYSIFNESIGTLIMARKGDTVIGVQVFTPSAPAADQLRQATSLVEALLAGL